MFYFLITVHVLICVALMVVVLLQQGKGAGLGAIFGGGSANTLFGATSGNVLTRATIGLALAFVVWSVVINLYGLGGLSEIRSTPVEDIPLPGDMAPAAAPAPAAEAPAAAPAEAPAAPAAPAQQ